MRVTVFTRFDSEHRPPLTLHLLRGTGSGGGATPLQLYLYNSSGNGMWGFHYDPVYQVLPGSVPVAPPSQPAGGPARSGRGRGVSLLKRQRKG